MNQKITLKGQAAISKVIDSTESFFDKCGWKGFKYNMPALY